MSIMYFHGSRCKEIRGAVSRRGVAQDCHTAEFNLVAGCLTGKELLVAALASGD
jgi:hypothetical protein